MTNPYEAPVTDGFHAARQLPVRRARLLVLGASITLLPFLWIAYSIDAGNPTWWKPFPMFAVVVAFLLKSKVAAFVFSAFVVLPAFALSNGPLLNGKANLSRWSLIFVFLHGLNGLYLLASFSDGVDHIGRANMVAICGVTFCLFAGFVILGALCIKLPRFGLSLAAQWLAWVWLILYSFPVLGPLFTLI